MPRPKKVALDLPNAFAAALETGVRHVLSDKRSTPEQRVNAINAGIKLLQAKHKIDTDKDEGGDFFSASSEG